MTHVKFKKFSKKTSRLAMYGLAMFLVVAVASTAYKAPDYPFVASSSGGSVASSKQSTIVRPSVDQLAATSLAARIAETANLTAYAGVSTQLVTMQANDEIAQINENAVSKPQVFEATQSRGIKNYKAKKDETVQAVADKFKISIDTVRWANNLTSDILTEDQDLTIPSVDGVVYTVKDGDTTDSLSEKYKSDKIRIVSQNDLEISGISPGMKIVLPGGTLPENERPGYVAPTLRRVNVIATYNSNYAVQSGNRYDYGYCTWYAYNRRVEIGRPVGSMWGNAVTWAYAARSAGYNVNNNPSVGAIMQNGGGLGHVAVVERVNSDGSIEISEMNYSGWGVRSSRSVPAGQVHSYNFIH